MPRTVGQVPVYAAPRAGGGRSMFYGDYTDCPTTPLFPFGHGLSYTTFERGEPRGRVERHDGGAGACSRSTTATPATGPASRSSSSSSTTTWRRSPATGSRSSGSPGCPSSRASGERSRFTVHPSRLAFYDPSMRFVIEPGAFTFRIGEAEAAVELTGDVVEHRQRDVVATGGGVVIRLD